MKLRVFALLAAGAAATRTSTTAHAWLRAHAAPNQDELAELKGENPDAYALVKALLTKRSLGLLDPKHPTASFAPAAPHSDAPVGAAAFALSEKDQEAMQSKGGEAAAAPEAEAAYPEVAHHATHNWMNWKPSDSAMDDDAMVKNVLGEVANLAGKKAPASLVSSNSALAADEATFGGAGAAIPADQTEIAPAKIAPIAATPAPVEAAPPAPAYGGSDLISAVAQQPMQAIKVAPIGGAAPVATKFASVEPVEAAAPAAEGNSYLKNIDFGLKPDVAASTQAQPQASAIQGNSYLRGIDFGLKTEEPAPAAKPVQSLASESKDVNYLSSFSWDDSAPKKQTTPAPAAQPKKKSAFNMLSSWLGSSSKAGTAVAAAATAQAPTTTGNPYAITW